MCCALDACCLVFSVCHLVFGIRCFVFGLCCLLLLFFVVCVRSCLLLGIRCSVLCLFFVVWCVLVSDLLLVVRYSLCVVCC